MMRAILIDARRKSFTELALVEPVTTDSIRVILGTAASGAFRLNDADSDLVYIDSDDGAAGEEAFEIHGKPGAPLIIGRRALVLGQSAELTPCDATTSLESLMMRTTFFLLARRAPIKTDATAPAPDAPRLIPLMTYLR
jgi:hypothetical protein